MKLFRNFSTKMLLEKISANKFFVGSMIFWGALFALIYAKMFYWQDGEVYAGWIGVWSDWAAHNAYASRFAYGNIVDWFSTHPLYIERGFTYPFLANAISGIFIRLGADRVWVFVLQSIVTIWILTFWMFRLFKVQLKSQKAATTAVVLFLTSGGLGFVKYFYDLQNDFWGALMFPPDQYTQLQEGTIFWLNTITGQLIPQRALLLGMTITTIILYFVYKNRSNQNFKFKVPVLLGISSCLLVVGHIHSLIVLVVTSAVLFAFNYKNYKFFLAYAISAAIPVSLIFFSIYSDVFASESFSRFYPGWLANPDSKNMNFFYFWFVNWGLFLPLAIYGTFRFKQYLNEIVVSGFVLFALSNLFLFQPFDWDNSKILVYSYMFLAVPVALVLQELYGKVREMRYSIFAFPALALVVITLTASGALDIYRVVQTKELNIKLYNNDDLMLAEEFREISNPGDVVLASTKHHHFVSNLTGAQVLMGYEGWMWTYGIDYRPMEKTLNNAFSTTEATEQEFIEIVDEYDIKFVIIDRKALEVNNANPDYFHQNHKLVLEGGEYEVFRVIR